MARPRLHTTKHKAISSSLIFFLCLACSLTCLSQSRDYSTSVPGRWSAEKINNWYDKQPWLAGANYYPATAINQIEMWQRSSWDPDRIDLELSWAAELGMNTMRVYLHDLVWANDEQGLYSRMDEFLSISEKYGIRPWFVFFDDCHRPDPQLGKQPLPVKAFHNSGWVNSPARDLAERYASGEASPEEVDRLKGYVQKTIEHFKDDDRVLMWELYNEPGRGGIGEGSNKLVYDSWVWAREVNPSQPITSTTAGSVGEQNTGINRINSDLFSIHSYSPPEKLEQLIKQYKKYDRPVVVSEWLARTRGSTVEGSLPLMKKLNVGAVNWGFVSGKTGTIWPWESRKGRDVYKEREEGNVLKSGDFFPEPDLWFHDLLRYDGTPYKLAEVQAFKEYTGVQPKVDYKKLAAYKNHDKAIHLKDGWIRDPYINLMDDGYYYLTGTTPEPNNPQNWTEPYNIGLDRVSQLYFGTPSIVGHSIRLWRSKDLFNWEYVGTPFSLEQGYWAKKFPEKFEEMPKEKWHLWAPEIYKIDGKWAVTHTTPAPVRQGSNLGITTGGDMEGPYEFPLGEDSRGKHDPSLFLDDDGTWYMLWANTKIAPLEPGFTGLAAPPKRIDPSDRVIGHEGATLRKIGDKYVHFGTAWSTDEGRKGSYNLYYTLSDSPTGPYGPRRFVGRFLGHGTPFKDKEGRWWCTAFYNANIPPLRKEGIEKRNLIETAQTINRPGTTIVPLEVKIKEDGDVFIRAKDPHYRNPGPDEAEDYEKVPPYDQKSDAKLKE